MSIADPVSAEITANASASSPPKRRARGRPFVKGKSGNPNGRPTKQQRTAAHEARLVELRDALASEYGSLTALEEVLVSQAASAFESAEHCTDKNRPGLIRLALQLMQRIRDGRKERSAARPAISKFDEFVAAQAARK